MRVVVTGCAGLIGSHLAEALVRRGDEVVGVDNYVTGSPHHLRGLLGRAGFEFVRTDVALGLIAHVPHDPPVDAVVHLACPASPRDFQSRPLDILQVSSAGTFAVAELAMRDAARVVLASTSEVYGEPLVHPQPEGYWGNVNPVGPRACYDEGKRFAEAVISTLSRRGELDGGIVRIFNTYGPRMRVDDGRVVSNFVVQALRGEPLTIQGDGSQTRSFCYVDDQVRGLLAMLDSHETGPINIGNPDEFSVLELAKVVLELTNSSSPIEYRPLPQDDPTQRRPDISAATARLGWTPRVPLREGLGPVIDYFDRLLN